MGDFKRETIREILGEAYTDEIAAKLVTAHRSVVDPLLDKVDSLQSDVTKYKAEAAKVPDLQQEIDSLKGGEDWKTKYETEKQAHEDYRNQVAQEATTAKVKAAYRKLLTDEKISDKALEAVLNATDYSKMKLNDDGSLDGVEDLKKDIDTKWGSFKVTTGRRGENVDTPPSGGASGADGSVRERMAERHARIYGAAPEANNGKE